MPVSMKVVGRGDMRYLMQRLWDRGYLKLS